MSPVYEMHKTTPNERIQSPPIRASNKSHRSGQQSVPDWLRNRHEQQLRRQPESLQFLPHLFGLISTDVQVNEIRRNLHHANIPHNSERYATSLQHHFRSSYFRLNSGIRKIKGGSEEGNPDEKEKRDAIRFVVSLSV